MEIQKDFNNIRKLTKQLKILEKEDREANLEYLSLLREIQEKYSPMYAEAKEEYEEKCAIIRQKQKEDEEYINKKTNHDDLVNEKNWKQNQIDQAQKDFLRDYKLDNETMCSILSYQTGLNWKVRPILCSIENALRCGCDRMYGFVLVNQNSKYYEEDPENSTSLCKNISFRLLNRDANVIEGSSNMIVHSVCFGDESFELNNAIEDCAREQKIIDNFNWLESYIEKQIKPDCANEEISRIELYRQNLIKTAVEAYIKDPTLSFINAKENDCQDTDMEQ